MLLAKLPHLEALTVQDVADICLFWTAEAPKPKRANARDLSRLLGSG